MSTYTIEYETALDEFADTDMLRTYDASGADYNKVSAAQIRAHANSGVVATTATSLTITAASHAGRTVVVNSAAPIAITLPQATGTGYRYRFFVGVAATGTSSSIKVANATDVMKGLVFVSTTSSDNAEAFATSATSDTIYMNGTTQGGIAGDSWTITDVATGIFSVQGLIAATGTEASPFAASVS